jgi:hypothetical protein
MLVCSLELIGLFQVISALFLGLGIFSIRRQIAEDEMS